MHWIAFFQNTDWGFWTFIIAVISVIAAIFIPLFIAYRSQKKKSLSYEILTNAKLISVHEEAKDRLEIRFDGKTIKNVSLLIIRFVNDGNVPILPEDFKNSLTLIFEERVEILSSEINKTSTDSLKPGISHSKSEISIEPTLLNAKDEFYIKSLILHFENIFSVRARIVGVNNVDKVKDKSNLFFIYAISVLIFCVFYLLLRPYFVDFELITITNYVVLAISVSPAPYYLYLFWKTKR